MNLENIKEGDIFNSYTEFCRVIEVEPYKGIKRKQSQIRNFSAYMELEVDLESKTNKKVKILKVYDFPKLINKDNSRLNDYTKYGQIMLLLWLCENPSDKVVASKTEIAKKLEYINNKFFAVKNNVSDYSSENNIDIYHIWDFLNSTTNSYNSAVDTVLNKLQQDKAILYNKVMVVREEYIYEDSQGKIQKEVKITPATDLERREILQIENEELFKIGCIDKKQLKNKKRFFVEKFEDSVRKRTKEELNISNYYDAYDIIMNKDGLKRVLEKYEISTVDKETIKKIIRESFKSQVISNAHSRAQASMKKQHEIESMKKAFNNPTLSKEEECRLNSNFIKNISFMANNLLP